MWSCNKRVSETADDDWLARSHQQPGGRGPVQPNPISIKSIESQSIDPTHTTSNNDDTTAALERQQASKQQQH
jgi:hypothetical protein